MLLLVLIYLYKKTRQTHTSIRYLGHIIGISCAYHGHILGKSWAYHGHLFELVCAQILDILGISCVWQKSDFSAIPRNFGPKKKHTLLNPNHVLATTGKSCLKKKVAFSRINISILRIFGCFWGIKCIA